MLYKSIKRNSSPNKLLTVSIAAACLLMVGCSSEEDTDLDVDVLSLAIVRGLTGDPTTGRTLPSIDDPKAQLGKKLFFTKGLGGNDDSACVTCHHPSLGGGDDLSLSIGVGAETPDLLGPGRFHDSQAVIDDGGVFDGGPTVPRNAPTTFNIGMWDQVLFHDGRVESLSKISDVNGDDGVDYVENPDGVDGFGIRTPDSEFGVADLDAGPNLAAAQSRFPVTSPEKMRGFTNLLGDNDAARDALALKLADVAFDWDVEFNAVYGDNTTITYTLIAEAIGEYERSQVFVDSPWKAYVQGDKTAISDSAKRGARMFLSSIAMGGANCISCHTGDFFTDEQFHVLATPQIGRGKATNNTGSLMDNDFGRFRVSAIDTDMYRFRTPSLLNVEVTGPWGHAGAYTSLENMVRHMLNPAEAIANYDFSQLDSTVQADDMLTNTQFALNQLESNRASRFAGVHQNVTFTEDDVTDLVAFLKALTDPCVKDRNCLAPWIPDTGEIGPDGLQLNAEDNTGAFL